MKIYAFLILFALSACATTRQPENSKAQAHSVIELTGVGTSGTYTWEGKDWSVADLEVALVNQDKTSPISEIRLLKGNGTNIMQAMEVGGLAEAVGAKAQYETNDNGFKSINIVK